MNFNKNKHNNKRASNEKQNPQQHRYKAYKLKQILTIAVSFTLMTVFAVTSSITYAAYIQSVRNSYKYCSQTEIISKCFGGGLGTYEKPFIVSKPEHLKSMVSLNTLNLFDRKTVFRLANDMTWDYKKDGYLQPIGNNDYPFNSIFDGAGHQISNLVVSGDNTADIGMFGYCGPNSEIKNFILKNPRVIVKYNSLPDPNTGGDRANANPLDQYFNHEACNMPEIVGKIDGENPPINDYSHWTTKMIKNEEKDNVKIKLYSSTLNLKKYFMIGPKKVPIIWTCSDPKLGIIDNTSENPKMQTRYVASSSNPSNIRKSFFLSGDIRMRTGNDQYCQYNVERYQVNILGTGQINEEKVKYNETEEISVGVLKTVHNTRINKNSPISVGLFIGRTDGKAHHLGMIGGSDMNYPNQDKGVIQIQGRGAYSFSTLIGRTRIMSKLDTLNGGKCISINYNIKDTNAKYVGEQQDKRASCWPDPNNVPLHIDANGAVYSNFRWYDEQQKRADKLTKAYIDPLYAYDYQNCGFINYPMGDFSESLRGETRDYHHYDFNNLDSNNKWRDGRRWNSKVFPQCTIEDLNDIELLDIAGKEQKCSYALKFTEPLGASNYSRFTCLPDNAVIVKGGFGYENQIFQNNSRWNPHLLPSYQVYGHEPDAINHHDGLFNDDPKYGYYWTHLVRNFAINNGLWFWATKDKTPVVFSGNTYDVRIKLKYVATNKGKQIGEICTPTKNEQGLHKYNFKILYNHYNPDALSYVSWNNLTDYRYFYHSSYMQNLMWYELNNPYNDEEKNKILITGHSTSTPVIPDRTNQNAYNPKEHMIIDDGKIHSDEIRFTYEKECNRSFNEFRILKDNCEWFPCFAIGMGLTSQEGVKEQELINPNKNGPKMGAYVNLLGSYENRSDIDRKNRTPDPKYTRVPFKTSSNENAIWNKNYLFYNAGRFQSWSNFEYNNEHVTHDGITDMFTSSTNGKDFSSYNDEGFFNTQYDVDPNDKLNLYLLKAEAIFTSRSGNEGPLIHHVDFLTGRNYTTFSTDKDCYTTWEEDSGVKPTFDVNKVNKNEIIDYAFGRTGTNGYVYGLYSNENYKITDYPSEEQPDAYPYYKHIGPGQITKY